MEGKVMENKYNNKGEIILAVLEEFKETLKEVKEQDLLHSIEALRKLTDEIIQEHPGSFSEEDIENIIKQARLYSKSL